MKISLKAFVITLLTFCSIVSCKKDPPPEVVPATASITLIKIFSWSFASAPLRFAESSLSNNTAYGFNRARISWYNIDPTIFYNRSSSLRPFNITNDDMSADECRVIYEKDLFPSRDNQYNQPLNLNMFNIDYYPAERGAWNYDTEPTAFSAGITYDGKLNDPATRWAGIIRKVETNDELKYNYLDFWILDPFTTYPDANGELVFDMGDISEDVLKDGLISAEYNTEEQVIPTAWGLIKQQSGVLFFPNDINRKKYDTGLDGLQSNNENYYAEDENNYFYDYLVRIKQLCNPLFYITFSNDPSGDDYHSFLGDDYDQLNYKVRDRYKKINGEENNSPINEGNSNLIGQRNPNSEDINCNAILDTLNNYFEYKIHINKQSLQVGTNYLVETYTNPSPVKLKNGKIGNSKFYHFRIPMTNYTAIYGSPNPSTNPKFIRMYFTGFSSPINMRFVNLDFSEEVIEYTH